MTRTYIALLAPLLIGGCGVGPSLDTDGLERRGASNTLRWTGEEWLSDLQGLAPTGVVADADGLNQTSTGPHRTMTFARDGVVVTLTDPLDGSLEGLELVIGEAETTIRLARLISQPSATIAASNEQVIAALEAQRVITSEQAAVAREALATGKSIAEALAEAGISIVAPGP